MTNGRVEVIATVERRTMDVSIICTVASWAAASASMIRLQTPARRQRTNRL